MQLQILDANYVYDPQGNPVVQLFGSNPEGNSMLCRVHGFRPYFYAGVREGRMSEVREAIEALGIRTEERELYEPIGYQPEPSRMLCITMQDPKGVREMRERVAQIPGVKAVYETDILFKNRFLIDRSLGGCSWALVPDPSGPGAPVEAQLEEVSPSSREELAPLRFMAFDIECLTRKGEIPSAETSPVLLISMAFEPPYRDEIRDLVLVSQDISCPREDVEPCGDEARMITRFLGIIREHNPDVLVGYNSNEFDIPYLDRRAQILHLDPRVGRDGSSWHIRKVITQTSVSVTGRVVVDLLPIIRSSFSLKQYTLRNASAELLGLEKYDIDHREIEEIWAEGDGPRLHRFISYSRRDSVLALRLLTDLRLMDKYIALSRASGSLLQDVVNGGQSGMVESLLLRRFRQAHRVVPPKPDSGLSEERYEENEELKGGAVLEPQKGLLEDVLILDYKSLYPTIMMAHNLCYSTVITGNIRPPNVIQSPSGGEFAPPQVAQGIVPQVLRELLDQRTATKRQMKTAGEKERPFLDAKQNAMKILLNSFYGYSGYARARLYSLPLANAVTSFGRENIVNTRELIEEIGCIYILDGKAYLPGELTALPRPVPGSPTLSGASLRGYSLFVVYGDTDSVFVSLKPLEGLTDNRGFKAVPVPLDDAEAIGRKIAATITASLPQPMELVFEAFARRAIFLAKKRYALWVFERIGDGWKDRIKVRGMETVRRDWCELTSKTLNRCLELLLKEGQMEEAVEHVRTVIRRLQYLDLNSDAALLGDLTLTRRYTKTPSAYKSKQPHIQLVEKMKRRGGPVPGIGDRVPFVIVRGNRKTLFVDKAEDPEYVLSNNLSIDTEYYIDKQLLPPVLRIFEEFKIGKEQLVNDYRQRNLFDFGVEAKSNKGSQRSLLEF